MKKVTFFSVLFAISFASTGSHYLNPVTLICDGLHEYEKKGIDRALALWEIDTSHAVVSTIIQSEKKYGRVVDYEIICSVSIGKKSTVVYAAVNYEYGPLYLQFTLFNSINNWMIYDLKVVDWDSCYEKNTHIQQNRTLDDIAAQQKRIVSQLKENADQMDSRIDALHTTIDQLGKEVRSFSKMLIEKR